MILIKNISIVNEHKILKSDVLLKNEYIEKISSHITADDAQIIDGAGKYLIPGIIDGQVHFRDPGLTHKGDIYTESKAAVAGGVTSFIDMPNTIPNVSTLELLKQKYDLASKKSMANFGFLMGVNQDNIKAIIASDTSNLLGITDDGLYFSKKGNLLADRPDILKELFSQLKSDSIIAIHAEKESIIDENENKYRALYGDDVPFHLHPVIRSHQACYEATKMAIELAKKYDARLHILHLTSEPETHLFRNDIPLHQKKITTEVSVQNLWFSDKDYSTLGSLIKWNPAIKNETDRDGLLAALLDDRIDLITTDHAPHLIEEKQKPYFQSMSGAPMVQHALNLMVELYKMKKISLEKIVEKMSHNPAILYKIEKRGFVREGYYADLAIVDLDSSWKVEKNNILYKCGWSPLEGTTFSSSVTHSFVNGNLVYENGKFNEAFKGKALQKSKEKI